MTVCAYNLTLVNLSLDCLYRVPAASQYRNVSNFVAQVIKFQHNDVTLPTIHTRVVAQVFNHKLGIYLSLLGVPHTSFLDIHCAVGMIMRLHILALALPTNILPPTSFPIAHGEIFYRLCWWPAPRTNFHFGIVTMRFGI